MTSEADQQSGPPDGGAYWSIDTNNLLRRQSHQKRAVAQACDLPEIVGRGGES